jgi:dual specificity MAP kinase phosphatase
VILFVDLLILGAEEARSSGGKVLVHCFAGASRSAAITIAYFLQSFNMTLDQAYNAIRDKRPCISPNLNFMGQLQKFEESLRSRHTDVLTEAAPAVRVSRTVTPVQSV